MQDTSDMPFLSHIVSAKVVTILNRYGHGQSYSRTIELVTALCYSVTSSESVLQRNISRDNKAPVTLSRFKPRFTTTHPDLRQIIKSGCIGIRRDGKKKSSVNTMSHDAPTVSARYIYGSTTTHDGSATIHRGGATNAHDASTIRYGASTIQAGSATVASRPPTDVHDLVAVMRQS